MARTPVTEPQKRICAGSVANFLGGHAILMDMTGFIPPTNRIAVPDTFRPSAAAGLS
jgi:hypothetical protein